LNWAAFVEGWSGRVLNDPSWGHPRTGDGDGGTQNPWILRN